MGLNLLNLFVALNLVKGVDALAQFAAAQQQALALLFVNAHSTGYDIALVFFSIYLLLLGYLMTKSSYFPGFLGVMLVVAGICYLVDSFSFLYPSYAALTGQLMVAPTVIAELSLTFWLLVNGIKTQPQGSNMASAHLPVQEMAT